MKNFSTVLISSLFALSIPFTPTSAFAGDLKDYQRKHISFFQSQDKDVYSQLLVEGLKLSMGRFDYHLLGKSSENINLKDFLPLVKNYQKEHAGELASKHEKDNNKFGSIVVTWSDTEDLMNAAYVFSPKFSFSQASVGKPYKATDSQTKREYDAVAVSSTLNCDLEVYKLTSDEPNLYSTVKGTWTLKEIVPLSSDEIGNPKSNSKVDEILKAPANEYFKKDAIDSISTEVKDIKEKVPATEGLGQIVKTLKGLDDFLLMGSVASEDNTWKSAIGFGGIETPKSLGIKLDDGFKITEEKDGKNLDIGFVKVRAFNESTIDVQHIISGRTFELGDQVREYPKMGFNLTTKFGFDNFILSNNNYFNPNVTFESEYSLASKLGVSEVYGIGSVSVGTPVGIFMGSLYNGKVEAGVMKKWYISQLILNTSIKAGGMKAFTMGDNKLETPFIYGGTAELGASWQVNPDMIVGFDGGYRFYSDFASSSVMSSNGPLLNFYYTYNM